MRIFLAAFLLLVSLSAAPTEARQQLAIDVTTGGLAGTFVEPAVPGDHKAVLMIAGSGPTDRNGNSKLGVSADYLKMLADDLAGDGIASLRYDKRGVGGSKALVTSEAALRFSDFVGDARKWADWLRARDDVTCVFLIGHSEGGLIATLVAESGDTAGLVLLASPGRPLGAVLHDQLSRSPMPGPLRTEALSALKSLEKGETVTGVSPKLNNLFRASVQPYLISVIDIDPARRLAALKLPTLVVSGSHDLQVTEQDYDALTRARPDAEALRIDGMNHVPKIVPDDRKANLARYRNATLPLAPKLAPAVSRFVRDTACPAGSGKG